MADSKMSNSANSGADLKGSLVSQDQQASPTNRLSRGLTASKKFERQMSSSTKKPIRRSRTLTKDEGPQFQATEVP